MLVRPVRTRKVSKADSSASATANGASQRRADQRRGSSAGAVSKDAAEVSALVIPAMGAENGVRGGRILMYSYHIVAELRQFRGAPAATDPRIHSDMPEGGNAFGPQGLTSMHRFFLAMMVSAVLLLIVAADLLVNGLGVQEPNANVASAIQVAGRFVR